jgi:hypothetical protein
MFVARVMATAELEIDEPAAELVPDPIELVDRARREAGG